MTSEIWCTGETKQPLLLLLLMLFSSLARMHTCVSRCPKLARYAGSTAGQKAYTICMLLPRLCWRVTQAVAHHKRRTAHSSLAAAVVCHKFRTAHSSLAALTSNTLLHGAGNHPADPAPQAVWSAPAWSHARPVLEPEHQDSIHCQAQGNMLTLSMVKTTTCSN